MKTLIKGEPFLLRRETASRLEAVDRICHEIRSLSQEQDWKSFGFGVELVARECLNNAVLHGNREDPNKRLMFSLRILNVGIRMDFADEGPGFNARVRDLPAPTSSSGRGFAILTAYATRFRYNALGNKLSVWMRPQRPKNPFKT